jgi:MYXO-CTERM domain-containing protein
VVTTLAGLAGSRNETDGTGTAAAFNNPTGIAVDASGSVYVVDTFNNTIRKITSAGVVTTVAGSAGLIGMNNGIGANALFNLPIGVAVDAANNIYVADAGNALIRKIAPGGTVTIVAGVAGVAGLSDTAGASALFNQPRGLARDATGNIYVADTGNALIRKIGTDANATVTSVALTVQLPAGLGIASGSAGGVGGMVDTSFTGGGSGGSSGGPTSSGGGAMESWFVAALILLAFARRRTRR